jgi:predicted TIM-barrel fold metal-dependent hydrolase
MPRLVANSADSHVIEPDDLWVDSLPQRWREHALRVDRAAQTSGEAISIDGETVRLNPFEGSPETVTLATGPEARLSMMDEQGVWGELLMPLRGLSIYNTHDPALSTALAAVYNDWLVDRYIKESPRWVGCAVIPVQDVGLAVREVERCAELGYRCFGLPATPPEGVRPHGAYNSPDYEPLWSVLDAVGSVVALHAGTGEPPTYETGAGGAVIGHVAAYIPAQRAVSALVAAGVLEQHPNIKVAVLEVGASWLSAFVERMDEAYTQQGMYTRPKLPMLPGDYVRRQVYASFQHDRAALRATDITGVQALLFATDYPHLHGAWRDTQPVLREIFEGDGVPEDLRVAATVESLAGLIGLPAPSRDWLAAQETMDSPMLSGDDVSGREARDRS